MIGGTEIKVMTRGSIVLRSKESTMMTGIKVIEIDREEMMTKIVGIGIAMTVSEETGMNGRKGTETMLIEKEGIGTRRIGTRTTEKLGTKMIGK